MWRILFYILGYTELEVLSVRATDLLVRFTNAQIAMRNINILDGAILKVRIRKSDEKQALAIIRKSGGDIIKMQHGGFASDFSFFLKRPVIAVGLALAIIIGGVLPQFVWFYRVEGNETVPTELILRELRELGVGFGTYGPSIHPQELKNKILQKIPELSWFTVQQYGGKAVIIVREREQKGAILDRKTPMDLVAVRSGIVTKTEIYQGNPLIKAGDCVLPGQILVSAYKDLDFTTQVSTAIAEVYAGTRHRNTVVCPKTVQRKTEKHTASIISIIIGRKRLKLSFAGSKPSLSSEKHTKKLQMSLPGGYNLPLSIEITRKTDYDTKEQAVDFASAKVLLEQTALSYVNSQLIAGSILAQNEVSEADLRQYRYHAMLDCEEMIGRLQPAKELKEELTNDGQNYQRRTAGDLN